MRRTTILALLCAMLLTAPALAQDVPPVEPPTLEPPTATLIPTDLPTFTPLPTLEPATATSVPTLPPPPTPTELPSATPPPPELPSVPPLPRRTRQPSLTASGTNTETTTPTPTASGTATASATATASTTETVTPIPTASSTPSLTLTPTPTPTMTYTPVFAEAPLSRALAAASFSPSTGCYTRITSRYAVVAPPGLNQRAEDFYRALAMSQQTTSANPYRISLCTGTYYLDSSPQLYRNATVIIEGLGVANAFLTNLFGIRQRYFNVVAGTLQLRNLTVQNAYSQDIAYGGGVVKADSGASVVIDSVRLLDNQSAVSGGAVNGRVTVSRSVFQGNRAPTGGAISSSAYALQCVRFNDNRSTGYGGAITDLYGGSNSVSSSTFLSSNRAFNGGSPPADAGHQIRQYFGLVNAQNNFWQIPPGTVGELAGPISYSPTLGADPTIAYANGDFYNSASPCRMTAPTAIPVVRAAIDGPLAGTTQSSPFIIFGWALDAGVGANGGTGVTRVQVYAGTTCSTTAPLVGQTTTFSPRADVQGYYGLDASYLNSGYNVQVTALGSGAQTYTVCALYGDVFVAGETVTYRLLATPMPTPTATRTPSRTPTPTRTLTPTATSTIDPTQSALNTYSAVARSVAAAQRECLEDVVDREIALNAVPGSGAYQQAVYYTWAVLNRLALTRNLDDGNRHGNNASIVYCAVDSSVTSCTRATGSSDQFVSANPQITQGITDAINAYAYLSSSDPVDGSIQWRSVIPNGDVDFVNRRVDLTGIPTETALVFWDRHQTGVQNYVNTVDVGGRIYTSTSVIRSDIVNNPLYYDSVLYRLGTATFFNRYTQDTSANAWHILSRVPPIGGAPYATDSCPNTP